jgi:ribosomal protein S18 acetylase RimI-like enzyme
MIDVQLRIRPAIPADQQQIANLIMFGQRIHRHLDWRAPLEWLGHQPYFILEREGRIVAALACPPDPPSIFWIRLFAFDASLSGYSAWKPLWDEVRRELSTCDDSVIAVISTQHWLESILSEFGFICPQKIVMLEWTRQSFEAHPAPNGITLRPMTVDDLLRVAEVDAVAFEPLWQNPLPALKKAFSQAAYASVAENESGMVGYQLSTGNPFGAHLARLAVRPEAQGRGIASALISDLMLNVYHDESASHITVNTQSNNATSLALYKKAGFHLTGEEYPVYIYREEQHGATR